MIFIFVLYFVISVRSSKLPAPANFSWTVVDLTSSFTWNRAGDVTDDVTYVLQTCISRCENKRRWAERKCGYHIRDDVIICDVTSIKPDFCGEARVRGYVGNNQTLLRNKHNYNVTKFARIPYYCVTMLSTFTAPQISFTNIQPTSIVVNYKIPSIVLCAFRNLIVYVTVAQLSGGDKDCFTGSPAVLRHNATMTIADNEVK
uniref:Uncharacterized LOC104266598 n=1 Tax=Ciona intestinalis TaxID=7719 RepID=F6PIB5_CIOIN